MSDAWMAFCIVNAKGKDIDSESWAFRMLYCNKRVEKRVRSLQEISENLFGNLKIEIPFFMTNTKSQT
jgi:hypothetical protein